jgi:hypothetical protein
MYNIIILFVPNESITLKSEVTAQSLGIDQGFFKCAYTKKCDVKRFVLIINITKIQI